MITIYAGHGGKDPGAIGNGHKEADLTIDLRDRIVKYLVNETEGVAIRTDDDSDTLAQVVNEHNAIADESTVNLEIHFNAASPAATGVECFIPDRHTDEEKEYAGKVCTMAASILGIRNRGVKTAKQSNRGRLYIENMDGCNILLEVCFISNNNDVQAYLLKRDVLAAEIGRILIEVHDKLVLA